MKFETTTINISTKTSKDGGAIDTVLTLTGCEVSDKVVADSLISGQSPRVRLQNGYRANGTPKESTMNLGKFITPGRQPRVVVPMSDDEIAKGLLSDPKRLKDMLDRLGFSNESEEQSEQRNNYKSAALQKAAFL